jgi:hypothetical protein
MLPDPLGDLPLREVAVGVERSEDGIGRHSGKRQGRVVRATSPRAKGRAVFISPVVGWGYTFVDASRDTR